MKIIAAAGGGAGKVIAGIIFMLIVGFLFAFFVSARSSRLSTEIPAIETSQSHDPADLQIESAHGAVPSAPVLGPWSGGDTQMRNLRMQNPDGSWRPATAEEKRWIEQSVRRSGH